MKRKPFSRTNAIWIVFLGWIMLGQTNSNSQDSSPIDYQTPVKIEKDLVDSISDKEEAIYLGGASDDGHFVAIVIKKKQKRYLIKFRDYETKTYDNIIDVCVSPEGSSFAATFLKGKMTHLVLNNREVGKYLEITDGPMFSSNGTHSLAIGLKKYEFIPYKPVVIEDGQEKEYDGVMGPIPEYFSPDGNHYAYVARDGSKSLLVIDGAKQKKYERTGCGPYFSPDNKSVAYAGFRNDTVYVVLDSTEYGGYTRVSEIAFGPSKQFWAAAVTINLDAYAVKNGELIGPYKEVWSPGFCAEGARFAFVAKLTDSSYAPIVDGDTLPAYQDAASVVFSPDGQHVAYQAWLSVDTLNPSQAVVIDGVQQETFEIVYVNSLRYSPTGKRLSYIAERDTLKVVAVVDGVPSKTYHGIKKLVFSPNEEHVAFRAWLTDSVGCVVRDGIEGPEFEAFGPVSFSNDSQHLSYFAYKNKKWYLVVNDYVLEENFRNIEPITPKFDENNAIHFFVDVDAKSIYQYVVTPTSPSESEMTK
jgi:hypothetical protein